MFSKRCSERSPACTDVLGTSCSSDGTKPAPGGVFDLGGLEEHVRTATWTCSEETWTQPKASVCCRSHKSAWDMERDVAAVPLYQEAKAEERIWGMGEFKERSSCFPGHADLGTSSSLSRTRTSAHVNLPAGEPSQPPKQISAALIVAKIYFFVL